MPGHHQLCTPHRRPHRRSSEPRLAAFVAGEYKFARPNGHAMQLRTVVQGQQPAVHAAAGREFRHHCSEMPPCALYSPVCVEFGKQTDDHAPSLPSAAPEGKAALVALASQAPSVSYRLAYQRSRPPDSFPTDCAQILSSKLQPSRSKIGLTSRILSIQPIYGPLYFVLISSYAHIIPHSTTASLPPVSLNKCK